MTPEQNLRMQGFLGHHKKYPKQKMEPPTIHEKQQGELNRVWVRHCWSTYPPNIPPSQK